MRLAWSLTREIRSRQLRVGYGRTSTLEQVAGLEAQRLELEGAGCEEVVVEQASAATSKRPKLAEALTFIRKGDVLVVTKPDRLARSVADLLAIERQVSEKGAALAVLSLGMNTNDATGKLMLTVLGAVAEFERSLMLERQREGIEKAKRDGKYKGRAPTARHHAKEIKRRRAAGEKPASIAENLKIGRASVYRVLARKES
jgi:DNA invertase Pin-like site-specific DNA recombinase